MSTSVTSKGACYHGSLFPALLAFSLALLSNGAHAQRQDNAMSSSRLKKMSLEELMNLEVTSVSMRPEKLTEVASAVQVITGDDIHRSGVTRLPAALRLASNLQMEQANSHDWAITARGFNGLPSAGGVLANKLLVMIDGRSVYSPLFGGVYWDVQNTLLQDLDRIEVVSGPGGTLWGANAVNGVINIITKSAKETQGWHLSGAAGSFLQDMGEVRYGGRIDSTVFFRVYGQRQDQRNTDFANGVNAKDAWNMTQGGFRMDCYPSAKNTFTLQGDLYSGVENRDSLLKHTNTNGQNMLARFTHTFSGRSDLKIQAYFDRTWRETPHSAPPFSYRINTYDIDIQHHFAAGAQHNIIYGIGYRLQQDRSTASLVPLSRNMPLYSGFIQDEITFVPYYLKLTVGSKFLHNIYSGFEIQPGARITWTPDRRHTIWTAVSRAVRTPTRFDTDLLRRIIKFQPEKVVAYELGYRVRPIAPLSLSLAAFYNHYHDIRSIDSNASPTVPLVLANSQRAESWGFELSGSYQAMAWWRLRGGYTYFAKNIWSISPKVLPVSAEFEGVDPRHQCLLQSIMDLPRHLQLDLVSRYAAQLPGSTFTAEIPAYFTFDIRLAWQYKRCEFSLVGQNLAACRHKETGASRIPRSIYGRVICQL